ncbi:MazG nucleotide pyrophosphohydrolase domain-containing protein [Algivirga pacifica]|uniref:MazG nucleotide pyrophosphohydrolase domain-containing protein n=1 Tax=Algivirga pacifica TaxID=1162670 RepID=A0ABP9DEE7_9BACT
MESFEKLLQIAKRKARFDQKSNWSNGSATYLSEIKKEVDEVIEEIPLKRRCYLEEELGDVLWDYLNILLALEQETDIRVSSVLDRACKKYDERISGIESGQSWDEVKQRQKIILAQEQEKEIK